MDAIEPHWVSSLYFAAFATGCVLAFLILAGRFPLRARPAAATSTFSTVLVLGNAALLGLLAAATGAYGYSELRWSTQIIVAGLVVLFAPGLFEALPARLRDGHAGLIALAGVQAVALAVLTKVGGLAWPLAWANMS